MTEWSKDDLIRLRWALASLYPTDQDARRVAKDAGLKPELITFEQRAIGTWFNIIQDAKHRSKIADIIDVALVDYPENDGLKGAKAGAPLPVLEGPEPAKWSGPTGASALEKIMGAVSTLVPISYFERGLQRAKSVARIKLADGSSGTGFLTPGNVLITNHHVLRSAELAKDAVAQFNYQHTIDGLSAPTQEFCLRPDRMFITSADDDWTAVSVEGDPQSQWGAVEFKVARISAGDRVNIIQHPGGGPKHISLAANVVVYAGEGRVQYLTDTLPGSSGSPVFDSDWNLVALHHSGGWLTEPKASTKKTHYRNEGIAIDRITGGLPRTNRD